MNLRDFTYILPKNLIADYPKLPRDSCRLMVIERKKNSIEHKTFKDVVRYLCLDDLLIFNDTKVLKARLIGKKSTGGKVDLLLLERISPYDYRALIKPADLKIGAEIIFDGGMLRACLLDKQIIRFNRADSDSIYSRGLMPLPPYIKRAPNDSDEDNYQTVYAKSQGAVASPTAGLHFTPRLLSEIKQKNINRAFLTLHINYATFKPVKEEDLRCHKMYKEYYRIDKTALDLINSTREKKKRVIAVGTTSCRVLETIADDFLSQRGSCNQGYQGWTDLFIVPGYSFKLVDCLLTNFHLPRSTLLMLVSAFAGQELTRRAYQEAIEQKYRFYRLMQWQSHQLCIR